MEYGENKSPRNWDKIFFWLILSAMSTFFAEVISGSFILPFISFWGWVAILPLYGLHLLVIGYAVFYAKPKLWVLFAGGMIFGLYEAYITKVLWAPPWESMGLFVGEVAIIETIVLVLWWHPFMSFIIPIYVSETLLTRSSEIFYELPRKLKVFILKYPKGLPIWFMIWAGLMMGGSAPSLFHALASSISCVLFLFALVYVWCRIIKGRQYRLRELLPSKNQTLLLMIPLLLIYVVFGLFSRESRFPGIIGHMVIIGFYIGAFLLLYFGIKKAKKLRSKREPKPPKYTMSFMYTLALIFIGVSAGISLLGLGPIMLIISWFPGMALGLFMLYWTVRKVTGGR